MTHPAAQHDTLCADMPVIRITDPIDDRLVDYVRLYIAESSSVIRRALEAGRRPPSSRC